MDMRSLFTAMLIAASMVLPSWGYSATLSVTEPVSRAVFQRDAGNRANVPVAGKCDSGIPRIEARYMPMPGGTGEKGRWQLLDHPGSSMEFRGVISVPAGGWYRIEVRAVDDDAYTIGESSVEKIGVGEVFITAGQSNSTNYGEKPTTPQDDRVSAWGSNGWQFAADPQPIATDDGSKGGSPWPSLGDLLVKELGVPVGFISVGWGGTTIQQWQPGGPLYPRMEKAVKAAGVNGARAVLWHQGESDTWLGTIAPQYARRLRNVIAQSRKDAGWDIPWVIARVSWIGDDHKANQANILKGQEMVCGDKAVIVGPTTDDMVGGDWRPDGIHFGVKGLQEHARRWAEVLVPYIQKR